MSMWDRLAIIVGKCVSLIISGLGLGAGETWPGEIALTIRPSIAKAMASSLENGVILVAGTNGKTTTSLMLKTVLESVGEIAVHNATGANLLNGVVSSFIHEADWLGRVTADVGIFEVDENSLPVVLRYIFPKRIVILNLFRDQLDRYGEVDVIVEKWEKALSKLPKDTQVILNSDDPGVAALGSSVPGKVTYFGVNDPAEYLKVPEHATDSTFCPKCGARLTYDGVYYSHIGIWRCIKCKNTRPKPDVSDWQSTLPGLYSRYNVLAAVAVSQSMGIPSGKIKSALSHFMPAFGRQERLTISGKHVMLLLSKNPAGFNASLRTVIEQKASYFFLALNDRIPDGRDVSWIWDVDFETIPKTATVFASGDRTYDMAVRLKYAGIDKTHMHVTPDMDTAVHTALSTMPKGQTLYVLPTYSAMLDIRNILVGHKIL